MRRVDELAKKEKAQILKEIRSQRMVKTRGMGARFCPDVQTSRRALPNVQTGRRVEASSRRSRGQGNYAAPLLLSADHPTILADRPVTTSRDRPYSGFQTLKKGCQIHCNTTRDATDETYEGSLHCWLHVVSFRLKPFRTVGNGQWATRPLVARGPTGQYPGPSKNLVTSSFGPISGLSLDYLLVFLEQVSL